LPVALVSDGVNKLLSILLSIANFPKSSILLDEIENGFYFDRMASICKTIYRFASEQNAQIFASTHSQEFLNAVREVMRGTEDDFALLHAQRDNGACSIRTTEGRFFGATLGQGFEIR
jgi:AAA15 family ATPase/GTPase